MKQTDQKKIKRGLGLLEELKEKRGGEVLEFHKRIANDPDLLSAFSQQYDICYSKMTHIPRKYRELIIVAMGCVRNAPMTIETHAKQALKNGATIEELGETLRLVFLVAGGTGLIPGADIFEPLDSE